MDYTIRDKRFADKVFTKKPEQIAPEQPKESPPTIDPLPTLVHMADKLVALSHTIETLQKPKPKNLTATVHRDKAGKIESITFNYLES